MLIEQGLEAFLAAVTAVAVYPNVIPQDAALPAVAYQRISGPRMHEHAGPAGLANPRFQLTCLAATYAAAKGLATACRLALDDYRGMMGTVTVTACQCENEADGYSEVTRRHNVRLDVLIWHKE